MGLFLISGINLARYSAIIPSEKNISEDTKSISVIMKNWYLNTNNFSAVKTKYKIIDYINECWFKKSSGNSSN